MSINMTAEEHNYLKKITKGDKYKTMVVEKLIDIQKMLIRIEAAIGKIETEKIAIQYQPDPLDPYRYVKKEE